MRGAISAAVFFVSWYRRKFGGSKLNFCLALRIFSYKVLGVYPINIYIYVFLPNLDGLASILKPK